MAQVGKVGGVARSVLAGVLLMAAWSLQGAELPPEVLSALKEAGIAQRSVSVVVQSVDGQQTLVRHNSRQAMNPARH